MGLGSDRLRYRACFLFKAGICRECMRGIEVLRIRMQAWSCCRAISTYMGKIQERDAAYTRVFLSAIRRLLD
ncbi:Choline transport protein [Fusarium oxysporum f. sp. albedinis]|jgi:ribosomal protein L37AE/L43A|nr:Choline transport protein [Fusarium oxysporum f. sp. albedinis]